MSSKKSNIYNVGSYSRFSSKEDDNTESNSIISQKELNQEYIELLNKKYPDDIFILSGEYVDDDYTGTNFNRPAFKQLKQDCLNGTINCIIVKDHSRFGRNAARMQIILEDDLEEIRYISNIDNFDSRFDDYDSMFQIKNTFNQMYAEDISKKVHSKIDYKQRHGKFIGSFCCYGYVKNKEDKNILEVDENVRQNVELIFDLRLKGMNIQAIARYLNEQGIPSPTEYKKMSGSKFYNKNGEKFDGKQLWTFSTIHRLLTNETYIGNLTQGRVRQKMRRKPKVKAKEDWIIAENSVPAIVSKDVFYEVQRVMKEANHIKHHNGEPHLFAGFIKCGECRRAFVKHQKGSEAMYFVCGNRRRHGKSECDNEYIRNDVLERIILNDLNSVIKEIQNLNDLIDYKSLNAYKMDLEQQVRKKESDYERLSIKRRRAYNDFQEDFISKSDYLHVKQETEIAEATLSRQIDELKLEIDRQTGELPMWIKKLLETRTISCLDRSIVVEMIHLIQIYKDNKIKITYKFANEVETLKTLVS